MAKREKLANAFVILAGSATAAANFNKAVNAFNAQDTGGLEDTLDENVILYKVRNGQIIAQGITNVITVLTTPAPNGLAGSLFAPLSTHYSPPALPAKVHGKAYWVDNDGTPPSNINYEFQFNTTNSRISTLWAQSD